MKTTKFIAVAALAALAAATSMAYADEADGSQFAVKLEGNRTRAEVQAEAVAVAKTRSDWPAGSQVQPALTSSVGRDTVRAQAVEAVRLGKISHGEAATM